MAQHVIIGQGDDRMCCMCCVHMEVRETHVCECSQFTVSAVLCDQHLLACRCPGLKYSVCVRLIQHAHRHITCTYSSKHLMAICPLNLEHFDIQMLFIIVYKSKVAGKRCSQGYIVLNSKTLHASLNPIVQP